MTAQRVPLYVERGRPVQIRLEERALQLQNGAQAARYVPLRRLSRLLLHRRTRIESDALLACAEESIPVVFYDDQGMGKPLLDRKVSYSQAVAAASKVFEQPKVVISLREGHLWCGDEPVELPPSRMAIYCWFSEKRCNRELVDLDAESSAAELLIWYRRLYGEHGGDYDRMETALRCGMDGQYLRPHLSKIKRLLIEVLGEVVAEKYQIQAEGDRLHKTYGLFGLQPEQITIT